MKRAKVADKKNLRNRMVRSSMRTTLKRFDTAVIEGDSTKVQELYTKTVSTVDKAAAKGVIHKNAANRKKAQLAKKLAKAQ